MRLAALVLPLLAPLLVLADSGLYPPGLLPLINRANALLSTGQFGDAAKVYSDAIEQSPADYLLYYKRATAYYSLGRHAPALDDFQKVLELTHASGSFDRAHLMSARIHAKEGRWAQARAALQEFNGKAGSGAKEAKDLELTISEAERAAKQAEKAQKAGLWTACTESASQALALASHAVELRQMRADCSIASGDVEGAVGDLTRLTHLTSPSTPLLMRIFRLSYFLLPYQAHDGSGTPDPAMNTLKQCLRTDPDSKPCKAAHRTIKALDKLFAKVEGYLASENWRGVLNTVVGTSSAATLPGAEGSLGMGFDKAIEEHALPDARRASPRRAWVIRAACKAYVSLGDSKHAKVWCEELLAMDGMEGDVDGLVGRAEGLINDEEYEEAVRVFEHAFEAGGRSDRNVHNRLQRAQKLLKQSRQKDYYKVLGAARDADAKAIKKAYRKATLVAHPDKGGSEAKMAAVNEAYEVLSNPELRARFDNGDDPNDPQQQQGNPFAQGGHPFSQFFTGGHFGGQQFSGGGGGFKFHYGG